MSFPRLRTVGIPALTHLPLSGHTRIRHRLSALSDADVEGPAVAGSARFNGLKKQDMEEGPAVSGSADFLIKSGHFSVRHEPLCYSWQDLGHITSGFPELFRYHQEIFSKSLDVQAMHRFFFLVSLFYCLL
ncbi:hypothetical protein E2C01_075744 [Portunus trituberculatus]|uniref:Uncharacterized protein n=1 Tax=Portunus trituberculatus TaxID=210409 RepID=A0A5B7IFR7_PORTR|nr:hypothetical protein [Portunus trituberculatus]